MCKTQAHCLTLSNWGLWNESKPNSIIHSPNQHHAATKQHHSLPWVERQIIITAVRNLTKPNGVHMGNIFSYSTVRNSDRAISRATQVIREKEKWRPQTATSAVFGTADKKMLGKSAPRIPAALALTRHGCSQRKSDTDKRDNKHARRWETKALHRTSRRIRKWGTLHWGQACYEEPKPPRAPMVEQEINTSLALQTIFLQRQKGHVYRNFHEVDLYLWSVLTLVAINLAHIADTWQHN